MIGPGVVVVQRAHLLGRHVRLLFAFADLRTAQLAMKIVLRPLAICEAWLDSASEGNPPLPTSEQYWRTACEIISPILAYWRANFGLWLNGRPRRSRTTRIWPSQSGPGPMPTSGTRDSRGMPAATPPRTCSSTT